MFWLITIMVFLLGTIGLAVAGNLKVFFEILIFTALGLAACKVWLSRREKGWHFLPPRRGMRLKKLFLLYSKICRVESKYCTPEPSAGPLRGWPPVTR